MARVKQVMADGLIDLGIKLFVFFKGGIVWAVHGARFKFLCKNRSKKTVGRFSQQINLIRWILEESWDYLRSVRNLTNRRHQKCWWHRDLDGVA
ncbi:hypothetical protein D3C72_1779530 [compost metagenome]